MQGKVGSNIARFFANLLSQIKKYCRFVMVVKTLFQLKTEQ